VASNVRQEIEINHENPHGFKAICILKLGVKALERIHFGAGSFVPGDECITSRAPMVDGFAADGRNA